MVITINKIKGRQILLIKQFASRPEGRNVLLQDRMFSGH